MIQLAWLIPVLPLIGFLINGIGRNKLPKGFVGLLGSATILASFIISLCIFFEIKGSSEKSHTIFLFDWISAGNLNISLSFLLDPLSAIFLLIITGVGFLIHVYSIGYMHHDEGFAKFFAYLNLFVFFMLLLVLGSNFLVMFIGWEGVGLCSYLLIGFWFKNQSFNDAAKKAFIMNRIGDLGFLLGVFLIYITFGSINYADVFPKAATFVSGDTTLVAISLLLFIGATGKSAQIPLYTWLPDAMAGPTPVSALIHAATMVTAGIYMIARSSIIFVMAPFTMEVITMVGLATAVVAALIALTQNDIKKVLAYSTVSQLGYMFVALGVGSFNSAVFHVMTHAFFKALLFLGAGSVIHAMSDEQDIRKMGGLKKVLPITFITFLIGTLAISGFPPFSGFFSKDEILVYSYSHSNFVFIALAITSILTAIYMFRMFFLTFYGTFRGTENQKNHLHESPKSMTIPLMVLALFAAIGGFFGVPEVFGGHHELKEFLSPVFALSMQKMELVEPTHFFEYMLTGLSIVVLFGVLFYTYNRFAKKESMVSDGESVSLWYRLSQNKFYVDEFYDSLIKKSLDSLSQFFFQVIEKSGIDSLVNGIGKSTIEGSKTIRLLQTGYTGFYIFAMVVGIIAILLFNFIKH